MSPRFESFLSTDASNAITLRFKGGLAALRGHDWTGELRHEEELAAAEQDFCMPGIGFMFGKSRVLHICPNAYGGATCFFLDADRVLNLPYANQEQQRRLLWLLFTGRHKRLAGLFESNLVDPAWRQTLHEIVSGAIVVGPTAAGFTLLIIAGLLSLDLSSGKSIAAALAHMLESVPFLLWMQAMIVVIVSVFASLVVGAIAGLQRAGIAFQIEGRDFTGNLAIAAVMILVVGGVAAWTGKWNSFPIHIASTLCFFCMFMWPVFIMSGLRRQQDRLLERIRAHYVYALTLLTAGDERAARQILSTIRKLEQHWHLGASPVVRYAHIGYAALINLWIAFPGQVFHYHINSHLNPASLVDTVRYMLDTPSVLMITLLNADHTYARCLNTDSAAAALRAMMARLISKAS